MKQLLLGVEVYEVTQVTWNAAMDRLRALVAQGGSDMAYSVPFKTKCYADCGRPAKHRVFNRWNEDRGLFCLKCAERRVSELNAAEKINRPDGRSERQP